MSETAASFLPSTKSSTFRRASSLPSLRQSIERLSRDLPVVLVGAGLPQLPGIAGDAKSYAERLFEFPLIGSLEAGDARAAIEVPAAEQGLSIFSSRRV